MGICLIDSAFLACFTAFLHGSSIPHWIWEGGAMAARGYSPDPGSIRALYMSSSEVMVWRAS